MTRVQSIAAAAFTTYQHKRLAKLRGFAPLVCLDRVLAARGLTDLPRHVARGERVVFHPSLPGFADDVAPPAWLDAPVELDGVVARALLDFAALQNPWELRAFLERVAVRAPRTVVEIGTSCGGLLFAVAQVAAPDATIISIDLPERLDTPEIAAAMPHVLASLVQPTQTLHAIRDRSTLHAVRADVIAHLDHQPIDLLIVDGDHSYGGVSSDVAMYAPLVRRGGCLAIHDAVIRPENSGRGFEVGLVWDELAAKHASELLVDPDATPGILPALSRPAAFGWGLITV